MEETTETAAPSVRAIGVKYGLISAVIGVVMFLGMQLMGMSPFSGGWTIGLIRFAIAIVILVLAQKAFKDEGDGFMTYGQGFGIGVWITLIAILIGGLFSYVYANFIDLTAMDLFYEEQAEQMRERGQTDDQIAMAQEWTKKLFWVFFFVFGFIFSLIVPLVVTIFTQKKNQQAELQ
jgi:ABC-type multidrug transport system fused ATPase/permease subunit